MSAKRHIFSKIPAAARPLASLIHSWTLPWKGAQTMAVLPTLIWWASLPCYSFPSSAACSHPTQGNGPLHLSSIFPLISFRLPCSKSDTHVLVENSRVKTAFWGSPLRTQCKRISQEMARKFPSENFWNILVSWCFSNSMTQSFTNIIWIPFQIMFFLWGNFFWHYFSEWYFLSLNIPYPWPTGTWKNAQHC